MPLFMSQFSFTPEAVANLISKPQDRSSALAEHLERVGGKLIGFYYSFGDFDGLAIYEAPDSRAAFGMLGAVFSSGFLKSSKTTQLLSEEEGVDALKKAIP
jgi:uncharacterized protein with GYD domain